MFNFGNVGLSGITLVDNIDKHTTYVPNSASALLEHDPIYHPGVSVPVPVSVVSNPTNLKIYPNPSITLSQLEKLIFSYQLVFNTLPGELVLPDTIGNTAIVSTKQAGSRQDSLVLVTGKPFVVNKPDFGIFKSASKKYTKEGDFIDYRIEVLNTGNVTLTNFTLNDNIDFDATYVPNSANAFIRVNPSSLPAIITPVTVSESGTNPISISPVNPTLLPVNEALVFLYTLKVNDVLQDPVAPFTISNIVNVAGYDATAKPPTTPILRSDAVDIPVIRPILSATKLVSDTCVNCGDCLTYTIAVHNSGNTTATTVVVSDLFESQFDFDKSDVKVVPYLPSTSITVNNNLLKVIVPTIPQNSTATISVKGTISCCCKKDRY